MRAWIIAACALLAACTPPAQQQPQGEDQAGAIIASETQTDPLAIALTPVLAEAIGRPVSLSVQLSTMEGDRGWIVAQPWTPEGAQIDWSQTNFAERAREGVLDGNGTTYALLRRENGQWRVVEHAVGPTDVAWAEWGQRHGAPASLFQMPPSQ
jgi:hypothetical protein